MSGVKASVEIVVTLTIDVLDFSCSIRARFLVADGFVRASTSSLLCEICSRNLVVRNTSTYTDKVLLDWSRLDTGPVDGISKSDPNTKNGTTPTASQLKANFCLNNGKRQGKF